MSQDKKRDTLIFGKIEADSWRAFCRKFRITIGIVLILIGLYTVLFSEPVYWWFLGLAPLLAGVFNFCPACIVTKKCDIDKQ